MNIIRIFSTANMNINIICKEYSQIYLNTQIFATLCSAWYVGHKLIVNILHHSKIYLKHLVSTFGCTLLLCIQIEVGSEKKKKFLYPQTLNITNTTLKWLVLLEKCAHCQRLNKAQMPTSHCYVGCSPHRCPFM